MWHQERCAVAIVCCSYGAIGPGHHVFRVSGPEPIVDPQVGQLAPLNAWQAPVAIGDGIPREDQLKVRLIHKIDEGAVARAVWEAPIDDGHAVRPRF